MDAGQFTAQIMVYNGATLLATLSELSNANGDGIFIGALDTVSDITRIVVSLASCSGFGADCNDFGVNSLLLNTIGRTVPEPMSLSLLLLGGAGLALHLPRRDQGHAVARYTIGSMYANGAGVAKDEAEAIKWYRRAAENGHAGAQFNLGTIYGEGRGAQKNDVEAIKWYRLAAEQGDASAQLILGLMYRGGEGVPQDYVSAHMWFNLSAAHGDQEAAEMRNSLEKQMSAPQIADAQKLAREWKPQKPQQPSRSR